jgi:hypothetical protein
MFSSDPLDRIVVICVLPPGLGREDLLLVNSHLNPRGKLTFLKSNKGPGLVSWPTGVMGYER